MFEALLKLDIALFRFINRDLSNPLFDIIFPLITRLTDVNILVSIAILIVLFRKYAFKKASLYMLAGVALTIQLMRILKNYFARPRPFMVLEDAIVLGGSGGYAFPSGHTTLAFCAAFICAHCLKYPFVFYTLGLLVGFSRVYIGVHYPSDVLAGIFLGIGLGWVLCFIFDEKERSIKEGASAQQNNE